MDLFDCDDNDLFPLHENLSSSYVDTNKLISYSPKNFAPIGMENFRAKKKPQLTLTRSLPLHPNISPTNLARNRWKSAAFKLRTIKDPWFEFNLDLYPTETAIRHRYNAIKKEWVQDECKVKIETNQFAKGAMRACFRLKKLSNFVHKDSWQHASNYVAKSYMDSTIPRDRYFEDVKLQMEAKLWAEIFNRHNPPKKIDMFQVSVLEFINRPNSPLFHLEHFIEGNYIKYNSNSGFVEDLSMRCTPQAFSHFTFECSNHKLMVVDIQGVGDLYTDPQIHTVKGDDYGDGNLGVKGFALFFSSHVCNRVCKSLGLTQFDLDENEFEKLCKKSNMTNPSTICRGNEEFCVGSPSGFGEYFKKRIRYRSENSVNSDDNFSINDLPDIYESEGYDSSSSSPLLSPNNVQTNSILIPMKQFNTQPISIQTGQTGRSRNRIRTESGCLDSAFSVDEAVSYFNKIDARKAFKPRPSCVYAEQNRCLDSDVDEEDETEHDIDLDYINEKESILGRVHLELCRYHELGRFLEHESDEYDTKSAFFHLKHAADLGVEEALTNIYKIFYNLPHDLMASFCVEDTEQNSELGFDYLCKSALEKEDKNSLFSLAKAYDTGLLLPKSKNIDWNLACEYYKKLLQVLEHDTANEDAGFSEISSDFEPSYTILARLAEMSLKGGHGLAKNELEASNLYQEAAEKAMQYGKGRIANKYYMLSEEALANSD